MATIEYGKPFTMTQDEVRLGIEKLAQNLKQDQGMEYRWENENKVSVKHKAAKGFVEIRGNEVYLELKLGLLFSAMAPMFRSKIKEVADKYIV